MRPHPFNFSWALAAVLTTAGSLQAQEPLASSLAARFLKIVVTADGGDGTMACAAGEMKQELEKAGITVDPAAKFAWAATNAEVQLYTKEGKVVIGSSVDMLRTGAPLALMGEGGKPTLFISLAGKNNLKVPTTLKRIARVR